MTDDVHALRGRLGERDVVDRRLDLLGEQRAHALAALEHLVEVRAARRGRGSPSHARSFAIASSVARESGPNVPAFRYA